MILSTLYIITLQQLKGCGEKSTFAIANYLANQINTEVRSFFELLDVIKKLKTDKVLKRFPDIDVSDLEDAGKVAERIIQRSEDEGISIVTYYDDAYPAMLRTTIDETGKSSVPILLYYKGNISVASKPSIAIIGTREPTIEGIVAGKFLAGEFAKRGFNIVSGLALGCDTSGHIGALKAEGATTAFLAHGLDKIYPPKNEELAKEILEKGGLLLSEYPIGIGVNRYNLVARDRLQAGLSLATLVVQTGIKGGTMHAANTTLKACKPLYCIWFKDEETRNDEKVKGNNFLIGKGAKYIKGDSNLDEIASELKAKINIRTTFF